MDADSEPILKHLQIEKPLEVNHVTHGGSTDNYLQEFYSEVSDLLRHQGVEFVIVSPLCT